MARDSITPKFFGESAMQFPRRHFLHLGVAAAVLSAFSRRLHAQAYPTRPIRLVIPFPPGGAFDAVGRPWADKMKGLLGTLVVENIGGGGCSVGGPPPARATPGGDPRPPRRTPAPPK